MRVVVFDDDRNEYSRLAAELGNVLRDGETVEWYPGKGIPIARFLTRPEGAALAVLDFDLTRYRPNVLGEHVAAECQRHGIPVCAYTFRPSPAIKAEFIMQRKEREIGLDVEQGRPAIARLVASYARGFVALRVRFSRTDSERGSRFLVRLLGAPEEAAMQLEQYRWGTQTSFGLIRAGASISRSVKDRIAAMNLGYWIANELLRYPGAVLNEVAAASYLDLDPKSLALSEAQAVFADAMYGGPFADTGPFWWSAGLDRILAEKTRSTDMRIPTGFEVMKRAGAPVRRSKCAEGHSGAGYYCIITGKQVCEEHSVRPPSLLPAGAFRSRMLRSEFDRLAPWVSF